MQYYIDMVPWYVWLLPAPIIVGLLLVFAGPWVLGIWNMLPRPVKLVLMFVGTLGIAFFMGRSQGNKAARDRQRKLDEKAIQTRQETHDEVKALPDDKLDKRIDKWMRD